MKTIFLTLIIGFFSFLSANAVVGVVQKVEGSVKVKNEGSIKKSKIKQSQEIKAGALVTTSRKGKVSIKLIDGSSVVLDVSSSVHFAALNSIEQKDGKVLYSITSRDAKNSLKVKTDFAIIGIKGTKFVITSEKGKKSVALKEGKIGVASIKEQFSLYRKEVLAQYNAFIKSQIDGFNKFKGIKAPEPIKTKEFDLKAGHIISFEGNVVKESEWGSSEDTDFDDFDDMMGRSASASAKMSKTIEVDDDLFGDSSSAEPDTKNPQLIDDIKKSMDF